MNYQSNAANFITQFMGVGLLDQEINTCDLVSTAKVLSLSSESCSLFLAVRLALWYGMTFQPSDRKSVV